MTKLRNILNRSCSRRIGEVAVILVLIVGCGAPTEFTPNWIANLDPVGRTTGFTGTITGRAEKHVLRSRSGQAYSVTAVVIESAKPNCKWLLGLTVVLTDTCYTAYPPESYAGKDLTIAGAFVVWWPFLFPGGPMLFAAPLAESDKGLTQVNVFIVNNMESRDLGTTKRVENNLCIAKRPTGPSFVGTWIGRTEKGELHANNGNVFPVTTFKIERPYIIDKPRTNLPVSWPTVILVDRCYTAYPPDNYGDKHGKVAGTIEDGKVFPFPGGPQLFCDSDDRPEHQEDRIRVLVVDRIWVER